MTTTLDLEWKHFEQDAATCERCGTTGANLGSLIVHLARCCPPPALQIRFRETRLTAERLGESNTVLFNGRPLEELIPRAGVTTTECSSCSALTGRAVVCRAIDAQGKQHEALPMTLLWSAATAALGCACPAPVPTDIPPKRDLAG